MRNGQRLDEEAQRLDDSLDEARLNQLMGEACRQSDELRRRLEEVQRNGIQKGLREAMDKDINDKQ